MFRDRKEFQKAELAFVQLFAVLFTGFLVSPLRETEINQHSILVLAFLHVIAFYASDFCYDILKRGYLEEFIFTVRYSIFYSLAISFASFMMQDSFSISRRGLIYFVIVNAALVYFVNLAFKRYQKTVYPNLKNSKRVFLITTGDSLDKVFERLQESFDIGGRIVAVSLLDDAPFSNPNVKIVPKEKIVSFATREVVDEVFINLPNEEYNIEGFISQFEAMGIDVSVNINVFDFISMGEKRVREVAGLSVVTFSTNFYKYGHVLAKRTLDIIGALVGLFFCGLAALVLVPLIKKDGGPAIFVQERIGKNGRRFKFYKFRSMYTGAEERKKDLLAQNTMVGGMFKVNNDPRITPIGRFIRKTSLDELPQFYNVLIGDMSLVGTRPPTVDEYEQYTPEQKRRLSFKPGITGLWQVSGRSQITDFNEVVRLDVAYIDEWTIWSDIKILLKTFRVVLARDGAK